MAIVQPVHGDVQINGINYRIDIGTYRVRDIVDFAPRASAPGGSIIHSELGLYQPYMKSDWRHGFGFMWESDAMGYMATTGEIDTRHAGVAMMMTKKVDDTEDYPAYGMTVSNMTTVATDTEYLFAWGAANTTSSLRKRTAAGAWSDEGGYTAGVNFVMETQNYILICPNGARPRYIQKTLTDAIESSTDATPIEITCTAHGLDTGDYVTISGHLVNTNANGSWVITKVDDDKYTLDTSTATGGGAGAATGTVYHIHQTTGVNANATDFKWLCKHAGFIYAGKDASSLIFKSSEEDLTDLSGDVTDEPEDGYVVIGGNLPTVGAIVYMKRLFVATYAGLYEISEDNVAHCVLDFSGQVSSTNFRGMAIHNNKLVFPIRDTVYMWNGATLNDMTPRFINDTFPYTTYGRFDNLVSTGGYLYLSARSNHTSDYYEDLLCWDGVGWHRLMNIIANADTTDDLTCGMFYDVDLNYLWISVDVGGDAAAGEGSTDLIYYVQMQDLSDFPFSNFSTTGTHALDSSRMDMGFRRVKKSTPSLFVEGNGLSATCYLVVWYDLDGSGSWTEWGGTGQGRVTSDGITEMTNPTGAAAGYSTIEYNQIRIRIQFVTGASTTTPVLEGFTLRFIMRPNVLYGHSFSIVAAKATKIGSARRDIRSVRDIYSAINTARDSKAPVSFVDPFGVTYNVYVASVERRAVERHGRRTEGGYPNIESQINVNIVELG